MVNADGPSANVLKSSLNVDNGAPLYGQILSQLEKAVLSGDYPLHAVLPGEKELSERFGVSRITAKRALNELAAKGLVRRMRGRGTVVVYNAALPVVKGSFDNLLQSLTVMGLETELELVSVEMEPSSEEVQIALGLDAGERVQRAVRVRRLEQAPFSHLTTFVPESIASTYTEEDLAQTPMLTLLERAGAAAVQADQTLSAAAASPAVAEALDISPAAPVFEVVRTLRDRDGRAVQLIHVFYRADRFKYEMRLTKQADGEDAVWRSAD